MIFRKPKAPQYRVESESGALNFSQAGSAYRAFLINWNKRDTVVLTRLSDDKVIAVGESHEQQQCH